MPFALEPHVAGELGPDTVLDTSTHPPRVDRLQYLLDTSRADDLIESFPVFLVSEALAERLLAAGLGVFSIDDDLDVRPGEEYAALEGDAPHKRYRWLHLDAGADAPDAWLGEDLRLNVSDRMMAVLETADLTYADVERL